jgi:hypothetical protein
MKSKQPYRHHNVCNICELVFKSHRERYHHQIECHVNNTEIVNEIVNNIVHVVVDEVKQSANIAVCEVKQHSIDIKQPNEEEIVYNSMCEQHIIDEFLTGMKLATRHSDHSLDTVIIEQSATTIHPTNTSKQTPKQGDKIKVPTTTPTCVRKSRGNKQCVAKTLPQRPNDMKFSSI